MEQRKAKDAHKELEIALSELENRVDRLRASYEQYFLGFEKLEPSVQRKDVDRRFTDLRKTQIRNTAQRFRFNVITQKFNTYSMYWTRICRQIEEGTFKRHLIKAAKRFGPQNNKRAADYSIDVELGDFDADDLDMDAVLAEANAAAEAFSHNGSSDTVPPGSIPGSVPHRAPPAARAPHGLGVPTPSTSFLATAGRRETIDSTPPDSEATPPAGTVPRAARHAALPPGAKPRVLLRRREGDAPPPSTPNVHPPPNIRAPMGSSPGPISSSAIPHAPPSGGNPPSQRGARPAISRPETSPSATSVQRLPVAAPSSVRNPAAPDRSSPNLGPPTPASPMTPQRPPASSSKLPANAPYAPYRPLTAPSGNRPPLAAPASSRMLVAKPAGSAPGAKSVPHTPAARPSVPDSEAPRPSRRPPPPLPSQIAKKDEP